MNLKELLEEYVKADLDIGKLEKAKAEIMVTINKGHLEDLSFDKSNIIEMDGLAYSLSIVHDRNSKKNKEIPLKLHKFSIHAAEIHK